MRTLKSQPQSTSWLHYAVVSVLLVSLFLVGLRLGSVVFAPPGQAAPAVRAEDKPSGGAIVNPPFQVHDFVLSNQTGAPMSLKDLRGRAIVLFFGYTHCPDVCPTTLADFTRVKKSLGRQAERVTFVLVTVDSKRDTPAVLKDYLNLFDPSFIGLTGDETTLRSMAAEYGAYFSIAANQPNDGGGKDQHMHMESINSDNYFVQHTSPSYLIDPKGFLRVLYFNGTSPTVIAEGIGQILQAAS
jgi:protein SCO1/2